MIQMELTSQEAALIQEMLVNGSFRGAVAPLIVSIMAKLDRAVNTNGNAQPKN